MPENGFAIVLKEQTEFRDISVFPQHEVHEGDRIFVLHMIASDSGLQT